MIDMIRNNPNVDFQVRFAVTRALGATASVIEPSPGLMYRGPALLVNDTWFVQQVRPGQAVAHRRADLGNLPLDDDDRTRPYKLQGSPFVVKYDQEGRGTVEYDFAQIRRDAQQRDEEEATYPVPMRTYPGKAMVFNTQEGQRGAQIINEDESRTMFGGRPALDAYIEEHHLDPRDAAYLHKLEDLANPYRSQAPEVVIRPNDKSSQRGKAGRLDAMLARSQARAAEAAAKAQQQAAPAPAPTRAGMDL